MGSGRQVEVSILVVSHDMRERTLACLDSILRETRTATFEIIVVDTASRDGSAAAIGDHPIKPRLFALKDDIGYGAAVNLAASFASGCHLLLVGAETIITRRAVDRLLEFSQAYPEAMVWGGRAQHAHGRPVAASCDVRMTPWSLFCRAAGLDRLVSAIANFTADRGACGVTDLVRAVDIVSERCLMMPRALWDRLGGFDVSVPPAGQAEDLCIKAIAQGARPRVTRAARIIDQAAAGSSRRETWREACRMRIAWRGARPDHPGSADPATAR